MQASREPEAAEVVQHGKDRQMTAEHTPTPWRISGSGNDCFIVGPGGKHDLVAQVLGGKDYRKGNAARILAANTHADLVAALRPITAELDEPTMRRWCSDDGRGKIGVFLTYDQAVAIHTALAKAGKDV